MKQIINLFLSPSVFFVILLSTIQINAKDFSNADLAKLVRPIESYAIQYGSGDIKAYVFVDPKCPHSRDFISMIYENEKMRGIYRYYIFFCELKRFKSHKLISTIYASSNPLQRTLEVMVGAKEIESFAPLSSSIEEKISDIERVATDIGVNKRPYLIINKGLD